MPIDAYGNYTPHDPSDYGTASAGGGFGSGAIGGKPLGGLYGSGNGNGSVGSQGHNTGEGNSYGNDVFGGSDSPGIFGTGMYKSNVYDPGTRSFINPNSQDEQTIARTRQWQIDNRSAPTFNATQLGSANQMDYARLGAAQNAGYSNIDTGAESESRAYQMGLMNQLQQTAAGRGPSIAGAQLQQGMDQSIAAQMAMAQSGRAGGSPALAQRQLMEQGANAQQALVGQSAIARMQEAQNAQGQLAGLSSNVRGQDIGLAGQQAGMNQAVNLANAGAQNQYGLAQAGFMQQSMGANQQALNQYGLAQGQLNQQASMANQQAAMGMYGMNDEMSRYYQTFGAGLSEADRQAAIQYEQLRAQQSDSANQVQAQAYGQAAQARSGLMGGAMAAIGGVAMLSDEDQKEGVQSASAGLAQFFKSYAPGGGVSDADSGVVDVPGASMRQRFESNLAQMQQQFAAAASAASASQQKSGGGGGDIMGMVGGMMSDERSKTAIAEGHTELSRFLKDSTGIEHRASLGHQVFDQLRDDYPPSAISWVLREPWTGPVAVPLDLIDYSTRKEWTASHDPKHVTELREAIEEGHMKPIILLHKEDNDRLEIVDGHHRALAYEQLDRPALAYIADVKRSGVWDDLHNKQLKAPSRVAYDDGRIRDAASPVPPRKRDDSLRVGASAAGEQSDTALSDFVGSAGAHSYRYKDPGMPGAGVGRFVSPMAQELETTPIGKSMVKDTPNGKVVDYGKGLGAMLAAEGMHERRIADIEAAIGKRPARKKGRAA